MDSGGFVFFVGGKNAGAHAESVTRGAELSSVASLAKKLIKKSFVTSSGKGLTLNLSNVHALLPA